MSLISERWAIFKEALGASRYGLPNFIRLAVVVVAAIYLYRYGHAMNWIETAGVVGTVSFLILFLVMLEFCLKLTKQIREARVELSKLRRRGVELRNIGQKISNAETFDKWVADTNQWHNDVVACISQISAADAEWFAILDSYPDIPREPIKEAFMRDGNEFEHNKRFAEHDFQLARLGNMIRDLWGKN